MYDAEVGVFFSEECESESVLVEGKSEEDNYCEDGEESIESLFNFLDRHLCFGGSCGGDFFCCGVWKFAFVFEVDGHRDHQSEDRSCEGVVEALVEHVKVGVSEGEQVGWDDSVADSCGVFGECGCCFG